MALRNKKILLISPQAWGKMFLTKHHYAVELAGYGNKVYFLNPPDNVNWSWKSAAKRIVIKESDKHPNVLLVNHQLFFPYILKFHARWLFDILMKKHLAELKNQLGEKIDIVWSFDHSNIFSLQSFSGTFKIFHPVDESVQSHSFKAVDTADVVFTVTQEILNKYNASPVPKYLIKHGVADVFIEQAGTAQIRTGSLQVGLSGNWLRPDLDHACLLQIIRENPDAEFNFFGSYYMADTNIGGGHDDHYNFISALKGFTNVKLHGAIVYDQLALRLSQMDLFLICYDVKKDQSRGTNYHKVMEYLSTGKVIVSNNMTAYYRQSSLVQMVNERENNNELPLLFKKVLSNLPYYNSSLLMQERKAYAKNNTYKLQIQRIEQILADDLGYK